MAEVVRPKFDVVRGWAGGGSLGSAHDKTFNTVVDGSGNPLKVSQGTFVTLNNAGGVTPVTADAAGKTGIVYCVVEGNDPADSYSGDYLNKVVGIRGTYEVLLSSTMYTAGAYAPGKQVSLANGKVKLADGTNGGVNGYVTEYDAVGNTLKIAFTL